MSKIKVNDDVREVAISLIAAIPEAGGPLSSLLTIIWKQDKEDVWTTLQGRVEEVIANKIADDASQNLKEDIDDLKVKLETLNKNCTKEKWSKLFSELCGKTHKVLATSHDEDYQLLRLPQAALFGVIFVNLWKLGKSNSWFTESEEFDTEAVNNFYKILKELASDKYKRKIEKLKGNSNKSKAWEDIAKIHNMLVLDVHPFINSIDKLLHDKKEEICNKYEIYSPPIGYINHDLNDVPLPQFRGTIIKELLVKHNNDGVYGWHIRYSDRSESRINSSDIGTEYRLDLAGKYISQIDFYTRSEPDNDFGYETIKKIKIYVVDFANGNNSIHPIELGSQDTNGCKCTPVNYENRCVSWIAGNPEPIRDEVRPSIESDIGYTPSVTNYYYTGLRIGFIPISEYKKLFVPEKCYYIINKNSLKLLEVAGQVQQNGRDETRAQEWLLEDVGNDYYYIINKKSGKVLNVSGGRTENGANIIEYDKKNEDGSKWKLEKAGDNYVYILGKQNNEFVVEVPNAWTHDEANIQMYKKNLAADCQKWQFVDVEDFKKVIERRDARL